MTTVENDISSTDTDCSIIDNESDQKEDSLIGQNRDADVDLLTHIPDIQSTFRNDAEATNTELPTQEGPQRSHPYNLRSRTSLALPKNISTSDESSVQEALGSLESPHWKRAIDVKF